MVSKVNQKEEGYANAIRSNNLYRKVIRVVIIIMTIGERIRRIRIQRGLTQAELGKLIGISDSAVRRYELNLSVPRIDRLKAIANALHVGITVFEDIEMETLCDVKAVLFQLNDKVGITFHGEKDTDGRFKSGTVTLSFDHPQIATFLKDWADMQEVLSGMDNASKKYAENIQEKVLEETKEMKCKFENACYTECELFR